MKNHINHWLHLVLWPSLRDHGQQDQINNSDSMLKLHLISKFLFMFKNFFRTLKCQNSPTKTARCNHVGACKNIFKWTLSFILVNKRINNLCTICHTRYQSIPVLKLSGHHFFNYFLIQDEITIFPGLHKRVHNRYVPYGSDRSRIDNFKSLESRPPIFVEFLNTSVQ